MSEVEAVSANNAVGEENSQNDKGVKSRKSKSPRLSTKEENEAVAKVAKEVNTFVKMSILTKT
jgi:hypothetical protein